MASEIHDTNIAVSAIYCPVCGKEMARGCARLPADSYCDACQAEEVFTRDQVLAIIDVIMEVAAYEPRGLVICWHKMRSPWLGVRDLGKLAKVNKSEVTAKMEKVSERLPGLRKGLGLDSRQVKSQQERREQERRAKQ